jgi:hypothetical protein
MPATSDSVTLWLTDRLLADNVSDADALVLERMATKVDRGSPLDEQLRAFTTRRPESPGEFGLEHAVVWLLPFIVSAVKKFMDGFLKKVGEKTAEMSVEAVKDRVRTSLTTDRETFALLEASFTERAAAMNIPRATYAAYLEELRRHPEMLLSDR